MQRFASYVGFTRPRDTFVASPSAGSHQRMLHRMERTATLPGMERTASVRDTCYTSPTGCTQCASDLSASVTSSSSIRSTMASSAITVAAAGRGLLRPRCHVTENSKSSRSHFGQQTWTR
eukprot:5583259-Prymnesium_polylepis.1